MSGTAKASSRGSVGRAISVASFVAVVVAPACIVTKPG